VGVVATPNPSTIPSPWPPGPLAPWPPGPLPIPSLPWLPPSTPGLKWAISTLRRATPLPLPLPLPHPLHHPLSPFPFPLSLRPSPFRRATPLPRPCAHPPTHACHRPPTHTRLPSPCRYVVAASQLGVTLKTSQLGVTVTCIPPTTVAGLPVAVVQVSVSGLTAAQRLTVRAGWGRELGCPALHHPSTSFIA
jgi:hypothetical protein